jgi:hypothetical protein
MKYIAEDNTFPEAVYVVEFKFKSGVNRWTLSSDISRAFSNEAWAEKEARAHAKKMRMEYRVTKYISNRRKR